MRQHSVSLRQQDVNLSQNNVNLRQQCPFCIRESPPEQNPEGFPLNPFGKIALYSQISVADVQSLTITWV